MVNEIIKSIQEDNTLVLLQETGELNIDYIEEDLDLFIEALETLTGKEYSIVQKVGKTVIEEYR